MSLKSTKYKMSKKGQITAAIILGIIIVAGVALFVYIRTNVLTKTEPEITITQQIPSQIEPIHSYITECVEKTAIEAIGEIGRTGGYIDLSRYNINVRDDPTDSGAYEFFVNQPTVFWYYMDSDNKCTTCSFKSNMPSLEMIEEQIDDYVDENLKSCLDNFKPFKEQQFEIDELGDVKTDTKIADNDIMVKTRYSLDISKLDYKARLDDYIVVIDIKLKKLYELAKEITEAEQEQRFLEEDALALIVAFSGKDENKLPPISASSFDFSSSLYWGTNEIEENIQQMLQSYVPVIKVNKTLNFKRAYASSDAENFWTIQRLLDRMIVNLGEKEVESYFEYIANWPIYFDINDEGGLVTPEQVSVSFFSFMFGLQRYNAVYDVSFPVLITLSDPVALKNKGYDFRFALEANLRNNEALGTENLELTYAEMLEGTMFCDLNKRNSGTIEIKVRDALSLLPVEDVQVIFSSGDSCSIGNTDENGILEEKFPVGSGELIFIKQPGYRTHIEPATIFANMPKSFDIDLVPIKTLNVSVQKRIVDYTSYCKPAGTYPNTYSECYSGWGFPRGTLPLVKDEFALVTLEKTDLSYGEENFMRSTTVDSSTQGTIEIIPGTYDVTIIFYPGDKTVTIPEEEICWEEDDDEEECEDIGPTTMNVPPQTTMYSWNVDKDMLRNANEILFYAVALNANKLNSGTHDDLDEFNNINEQYYTNSNPGAVRPVVG